MNSGYYIHELAITVMYMMIEHPNPIEVGGPVLAGWESVLPLNEAEKDCLYMLVLCRFCQSLVLARYSVSLQPENAEYLMISSKRGIHIVCQLWELGKEHVEKVWFQSAAQFSDRKWEICEESHSQIPLNHLCKSYIILTSLVKCNRLCFHSLNSFSQVCNRKYWYCMVSMGYIM